MKTKSLILLVITCVLVMITGTIQAEMSLSAGVPMSYSFDKLETSDGEKAETESIRGFLLHVSLPIFMGFGIESYTIKFKDDPSDTELKVEMLDIFYLLPTPYLNLTAGIGFGSVRYDCDTCDQYYENSSGNAFQWYLQLGIPIAGVVDIHVSYHGVRGQVDAKDEELGEDSDVGGKMMAVGFALLF